ncbi:RICIN domain-containing protein [Streptomyces sp. NPDC002596]|uniref:RICIN domain-containing protein n=1 Tax=unclassified Streptomyces TaxID=2593676 RepID=UPI002DDBDBA2|nr:RICIN domain-containing protein [Streptomyces sp. NBC_00841]WSA02754.1 RICIN domain-containing protein [Streptomyces sp. NBC_00841]
MNVKSCKRWAVGLGAVATSAALVSGSFSPAVASDPAGAAPRSVVAKQLTLRLAAAPGQVANVRGAAQGNGVPIIQYPWSLAANERWEANAVAGGYYRFKSVSSGKCLNVSGGGTANGTPVIQYTCSNSDNALWRLVPEGIGYQIVVKSSDMCLNVAGGVGAGRPLVQYDCTAQGATNDVWLPVWEPDNL